MIALTKIRDVWNDIHYVRQEDLSDMRKTLMPLFRKDGTHVKARAGYPKQYWDNVRIHRDNIASIVRAA